MGRNPSRGGYALQHQEWDGSKDPLFVAALDVVEETLHQNRHIDSRDLKRLFRLQMAYTLLWTAIERFTAFTWASTFEPRCPNWPWSRRSDPG